MRAQITTSASVLAWMLSRDRNDINVINDLYTHVGPPLNITQACIILYIQQLVVQSFDACVTTMNNKYIYAYLVCFKLSREMEYIFGTLLVVPGKI